jgi:predicted Fe-Mo cluster-binding NifX family protein
MKVVVTANGTDLDAQASPVFGRCPTYIFVETETMVFEALDNPAISAPGGAGIQAAQFVVQQGAQAVLTGNTGPNAFQVLQSANVPVYLFPGGTVRQAVEAYKAGQLSVTGGATAPAHAGMGRMGMGRGRGRGMGMGRSAAAPAAPPSPLDMPSSAHQEEVSALKDAAAKLRTQLAELMERLDRLEGEG